MSLLQTNGHSNGLVPMLRVYNATARYVDQGGNKVRSVTILIIVGETYRYILL